MLWVFNHHYCNVQCTPTSLTHFYETNTVFTNNPGPKNSFKMKYKIYLVQMESIDDIHVM